MAVADGPPNVAQSGLVYAHKTNGTNAAVRTVEKAMAVAGGQGYLLGMGLERRFRDIQAAEYDPSQEARQYRFSGRIALGLEPIEYAQATGKTKKARSLPDRASFLFNRPSFCLD